MNISLLLLTYNRPDHTARVLEGIRREGVDSFTIHVDAPLSTRDEAAQRKMDALFREVHWARLRVVRRRTNKGLAAAIIGAVSEELRSHQAVVVLEDDCCPRPGFYRYMTTALRKYAAVPYIRSVCAYQFPFAEKPNAVRGVLLKRFIPWGWGTWRDRWTDYTLDIRSIVSRLTGNGSAPRLPRDLQRYCSKEYYLEQKGDIWSLNWVLLHYLTDTYSLFPTRSLIENIGFDGTGVHSVRTRAFAVSDDQPSPESPVLSLSGRPSPHNALSARVDAYLSRHSRKVMVKRSRRRFVRLV